MCRSDAAVGGAVHLRVLDADRSRPVTVIPKAVRGRERDRVVAYIASGQTVNIRR